MRFGLADVRNYDSVELASSLSWFKPLYDPTLRRSVEPRRNHLERRDRRRAIGLIESGVGAIVAASPPPEGAFDRVEQVGRVWIGWLAGKPWADSDSARARLAAFRDHGRARILIDAQRASYADRARDLGPGMEGAARRPTRQNPAEIDRFF